MKLQSLFLLVTTTMLAISCTSPKTLYKGNKFYYIEKHTGDAITYKLIECTLSRTTKATLDEKADYLLLEIDSIGNIDTMVINSNYSDISDAELARVGKYYFPGKKGDHSLRYFDIKLGLQAMTIPLKFRRSVGNDLLNPPTIEAGVNVGFAPGWKFTHNVHKKTKNYLGKNTSQYAIAVGPLFGLGATDLKKASNAPGIGSDRKSALFTWGGYALLGFNNVNIGFAVGADKIVGQKNARWVYENKLWKGIIVSLDILKY